jgi:hypothetical protein
MDHSANRQQRKMKGNKTYCGFIFRRDYFQTRGAEGDIRDSLLAGISDLPCDSGHTGRLVGFNYRSVSERSAD